MIKNEPAGGDCDDDEGAETTAKTAAAAAVAPSEAAAVLLVRLLVVGRAWRLVAESRAMARLLPVGWRTHPRELAPLHDASRVFPSPRSV